MKQALFGFAVAALIGAPAFAMTTNNTNNMDIVALARPIHHHAPQAPVRTCTPDPQGNKYSYCNDECTQFKGDGQGRLLDQCINDCVARYCAN